MIEQTFVAVAESEQAALAIHKAIGSQGASGSQITERRNLDGDTAAWIVVATLSSQVLPHVLNFIKDLTASSRVKKLKYGDWEVENPTPEMVEKFMHMPIPPQVSRD